MADKTPDKPAASDTTEQPQYNPVNMAGKKAEGEEQADEGTQAGKSDYNPVNMAGKKTEPPQSENEGGHRKP